MRNNDLIPVYTEYLDMDFYNKVPFVRATDIMKFLGYKKTDIESVGRFFSNNYRKFYGSSELGHYWCPSGRCNRDYEHDDYYFSKDGLIELIKHIKKSPARKKELLEILDVELEKEEE